MLASRSWPPLRRLFGRARGYRAGVPLCDRFMNEAGYGSGSYRNPQDITLMDDTRITTSIPYVGKLMGSYAFSHGITVSGFFQHLSGTN